MSDKMDLVAALAALDPAIDAHWTKKGEPSLNALKEMTGHAVSRGDAVSEARVGFNRNMAAGDALDESGPEFAGHDDPPGRDYIGELDELFAGLTNDHRVFTDALWRLAQYYRAERLNIQRQIDGSRERGRNV